MQKAEENKEIQSERAVVVSIHDVSPLTQDRTEAILGDLKKLGVPVTSLLVIPDHHHCGLISENSAFGGWLRAKCDEGHEAVLHGYFHLRETRITDDLKKRIITRSYTAGEGEFFDLEKPAARDLLDRGRAALEACGVCPGGFIAPAWLLGAEAEQAVREAGFEYTTRIATVSDFLTGILHPSRSQVWSVRAGWRRTCSLAWNALLFQKTLELPLTRIGIHPPDWEHPRIREQILKIAGESVAGREAMTYAGWLSRMRG
ncbi:MAG: DUF2334 domain-containing protein [Terrimicrobiaceae bacterium]